MHHQAMTSIMMMGKLFGVCSPGKGITQMPVLIILVGLMRRVKGIWVLPSLWVWSRYMRTRVLLTMLMILTSPALPGLLLLMIQPHQETISIMKQNLLMNTQII